jgi:hypothetical protein
MRGMSAWTLRAARVVLYTLACALLLQVLVLGFAAAPFHIVGIVILGVVQSVFAILDAHRRTTWWEGNQRIATLDWVIWLVFFCHVTQPVQALAALGATILWMAMPRRLLPFVAIAFGASEVVFAAWPSWSMAEIYGPSATFRTYSRVCDMIAVVPFVLFTLERSDDRSQAP